MSGRTYGSGALPGKRGATGPPGVSDIANTMRGMVGSGRAGTLTPPGSRPFNPTSGLSGDVVRSQLQIPSLTQNIPTNGLASWTNGFTPFARLARGFINSDLNVDLMETGMIICTMRDKRTTTPFNNPRHEFISKNLGVESFLRKRPMGNRHIMLDPIRTNYLLASTEPATTKETQDRAWTLERVLDTWHFADGIVLNQEGGKSVFGVVDDPSRARLLNMIVHGRIEGVLNIWGNNLATDSELYLVLKRCPRPKGYVLDPTTSESGAERSYTSGGNYVRPRSAAGIIRQAESNGVEKENDTLVKNPWQLTPFMPKGDRVRPTMKDTLGEDDHGNLVYGCVIRLGKTFFPGATPRTSPFIEHLKPLDNMSLYISCGVVTVLTDNHGFRVRK